MSQKINHDYICSCLDESMRVMGLTLDEFIPLLVIFAIAMVTNHLMLGFVGMAACYAALKQLKKGQGGSALLIILYKNAGSALSTAIFRLFPVSTKRVWW